LRYYLHIDLLKEPHFSLKKKTRFKIRKLQNHLGWSGGVDSGFESVLFLKVSNSILSDVNLIKSIIHFLDAVLAFSNELVILLFL